MVALAHRHARVVDKEAVEAPPHIRSHVAQAGLVVADQANHSQIVFHPIALDDCGLHVCQRTGSLRHDIAPFASPLAGGLIKNGNHVHAADRALARVRQRRNTVHCTGVADGLPADTLVTGDGSRRFRIK